MARTRQTPRKKKDPSPKKKRKSEGGQVQPTAEASETMDTSQACEKAKVIQDPPTSEEQKKVGEEGTNVHQESESGSESQKDTAQAKSPVSPQEKSPQETAGRKRKKEDDGDTSAPVGESQTETGTSPKKTKLSKGSKDSEHSDSDQQGKEEVKKEDSKQVEPAPDKSGDGTCEVEKVGSDGDEAPEDLSLAEGKQIAMEQKQDESVQAQRLE